MRNIKYILIVLLCIVTSVEGWSQEDKEAKRVETEKNTKPFGLNYFTSAENRMYVLDVAVVNKVVTIDSTAIIREVPGKLPYPSDGLNVSVLGRDNKVIGDYRMPDPLLQRSCEEGKDHLDYLVDGRILIPIPKDANITRIILRRDKEEVSNLNIETLIKEVPRRDPNKN
jgi:hypothetical protein